MAQGSGRIPRRIVKFNALADEDRFDIYERTQRSWGTVQAQEYRTLLEATIKQLTEFPKMARLVSSRKATRVYLVRWKNALRGHRIFFREIEDGILVIRILHTSMDSSFLTDEG